MNTDSKPIDRDMFEFVNAAAGTVESGKCLAIAMVVIDNNSQAAIRFRYLPGSGLNLAGGVSFLQKKILEGLQKEIKNAAAPEKPKG